MTSETSNSTSSTPSPPERIYFLSQRERDRLEKRASRMAFKEECLELTKAYTDCTSKTMMPPSCWSKLHELNDCLKLARESQFEKLRVEKLARMKADFEADERLSAEAAAGNN